MAYIIVQQMSLKNTTVSINGVLMKILCTESIDIVQEHCWTLALQASNYALLTASWSIWQSSKMLHCR